MIEKPSIIVTSGGRTGTRFFYELFNSIIQGCIAFHEPENINLKEPFESLWKIKKFGFWNASYKKMHGDWGITSISNRRMSQRININKSAKLLLNERKKFVESFSERIYVEASYHYYGLIDVLPMVFKHHRVVYITRDGRDWVRSQMNKKEFYHKKNPHTRFKTRISPDILNDKNYIDEWDSMSRFEKLCWAWTTINKYALSSMKKNENARLFYFEDIFYSDTKYDNLRKLVDFLTFIPNCEKIEYDSLEGKLEEKVNQPPEYEFPSWEKWSLNQKNKFRQICGDLMKRLNYDL